MVKLFENSFFLLLLKCRKDEEREERNLVFQILDGKRFDKYFLLFVLLEYLYELC